PEPKATADDEERPRRKDEQSDAEARPQHEQVEGSQDPQRRRHGLDTPFRRPAQTDHREAKASAYISGSRAGRRPAYFLDFANFLYECLSAMTSGRSFPARKLMSAPPPVLTWSILTPNPNCSTADTVTPP